MNAVVTPIGASYAAHVEIAPRGMLSLTLFVTTDPGPAREFRPLLDVTLDEDHGLELLGTLMLALQNLRERRMGSAAS